MAEPFKNLVGAAVVHDIAQHLARVWPAFGRRGFEQQALAGLEDLEMKARVMQLAQALQAHLPAPADQALTVMVAALGPPGEGDDLKSLRSSPQGLAGWAVWPLTEAVALIALPGHAARGLAALHAMTQRLTAEFAVRHFLIAEPALSLATLARWVHDPSAHVRRLVSEGSRPRLPWGLRLQALVADPSPALPLLRALQDDPSAYVRRSVANHLNDIGKDHPDLLVQWLQQHLPGASAQRQALLRHASRSLVKQCQPEVLAAWGLGRPLQGRATLALAPTRLRVGEALLLNVGLHSTARRTQKLQLDYVVQHARPSGRGGAKVFKGWALDLAPGQSLQLQRRHSFRVVTTRRYHPGVHQVALQVNGQTVARGEFWLEGAAVSSPATE